MRRTAILLGWAFYSVDRSQYTRTVLTNVWLANIGAPYHRRKRWQNRALYVARTLWEVYLCLLKGTGVIHEFITERKGGGIPNSLHGNRRERRRFFHCAPVILHRDFARRILGRLEVLSYYCGCGCGRCCVGIHGSNLCEN